MATDADIYSKIEEIILDGDYEDIYNIYDGGNINNHHELWLKVCRYRDKVNQLAEMLNG